MRRLSNPAALLIAALAFGCGSECSDNESSHEERVQGVTNPCSPEPTGECAAAYCAGQCPKLTGTNNASFTLDECRMQQTTTLVCHYTRTSEWCD